MRILHTADWHVGKVLKGRNRLDEHDAVLADIVRAAGEEDVDLVLVAGDVFDTSAPNPDAQRLVMRTLLDLNRDGRRVVVEAGNHDNPRQLDVFRPVLGELGITVVGMPLRAEDGGTLTFTARTGEKVRLAILPFISHRTAISASEAITRTAAETNRDYADCIRAMVEALCVGFDKPGGVNLLMTHATLVGGQTGGGERDSQIFEYSLNAASFPSVLHYGALGHLHRRQSIAGPAPLHYSGSPLQVDFGESENTSVAVVVDVTEDTPAVVRDREILGGRRLRTVRTTFDELASMHFDEDEWLRVVIKEKPRAGLSEDVREIAPGALEVRIDPEFLSSVATTTTQRNTSRSPIDLFGDYLQAEGRGDLETLTKRFAELLDEIQHGTGV
ncbi:exonuclease SbcCD subunit D [Nocardioides sp. URHA0020]|uniref:exonuclease SbcCD subunit D n=1 Tax=Nocardioides sp. URHA0020 TaxID=1380392 RepID=UPI00048D7304|nr:exonuclease SbcCD subunit D [Nocardioides sp. URHA0020]